jgi:hypothetical protein
MTDLLAIECQLSSLDGSGQGPSGKFGTGAATSGQPKGHVGQGEDASSKGGENFYKSGKSNTLKSYYKKVFKNGKDGKSQASTGAGDIASAESSHTGQLQAGLSNASSLFDDACSESVAMSELGRGSRASTRHDSRDFDESDKYSTIGSNKGTLKGMFKKSKKNKQIELDALRWVLDCPISKPE